MSESPVSLEELLRLKRHERPEGDFWEGFERDFQHRRLRALMEEGEARFPLFRPGAWARLLIWSPVAGGALAALALLLGSMPGSDRSGSAIPHEVADLAEPAPALAGSALLAGHQAAPRTDTVLPTVSAAPRMMEAAPVSSIARPRFVIDALATEDDSRSFRRVLSSASLSVPTSSGSRYVADPLTAGRMEAAPAVMRARSHF